jgi:hypothetical protein
MVAEKAEKFANHTQEGVLEEDNNKKMHETELKPNEADIVLIDGNSSSLKPHQNLGHSGAQQ